MSVPSLTDGVVRVEGKARRGSTKGSTADQLSVSGNSASTAGWAISAYQRDRDTVFRGSNLESPAPTLDVRISDLITPLPPKPAGQAKESPTQISPTESDPFSDYLSYESVQGDMGEEVPQSQMEPRRISRKTAFERSRPQLQCTTTFASDSGIQSQEVKRVTVHSPLDALCRELRTPAAADLPLSPSPASPKPKFIASDQDRLRRGPGQSIDDATIYLARSREIAPARKSEPVPTSLVGVTPNFSLPAAGRRVTAQLEAENCAEDSSILQTLRRGYRRTAPVISCLAAILAAVSLMVCGHNNQTGATILATLPAQGFDGLGPNTEYVEMYASQVCLRQQGVSDAR
jgi:hypothetical protein